MLSAAGHDVALLDSDGQGRIEPESLARELAREGEALVTVVAGHNEVATLQPLQELADIVHRAGGLLHLDAVQAAAYVDLSDVAWDLASVSAHKLGGPVGIGALLVRAGVDLVALMGGGAQERGLRPGTVPVSLACGFGAAAVAARAHRRDETTRLVGLRRRLADELLASGEGLRPLGAWYAGPAVPHIAAFVVAGVRGEDVVLAADEEAIAVGSSSACIASQRSPVLDALGVAMDDGLLRVSLGWCSSADDCARAVRRLGSVVRGLRAVSPFERRRRAFEERAREAGLALSGRHWDVAAAVFDFHQREGVLPGPRYLSRAVTGAGLVGDFFPGGLATVARWLGLPTPQGGCRSGL